MEDPPFFFYSVHFHYKGIFEKKQWAAKVAKVRKMPYII